MKDIVQFFDKTIAESTSKINKTGTSLKSNTNQEPFKAIKIAIQSNETAAKMILQQRNFKRFNNLKHKPKSAIQPTPQQELEAQEQPKKSLYSDILKRKRGNTAIRRTSSETNIQHYKHDTVQILKSLNIINTKGKAPLRSNTSTKQNEEKSLKLQIKQLKQEEQYLKNNSSKKNIVIIKLRQTY